MPAQRPRASFEPIPPDLDVIALVEDTPNFQFCDRVAWNQIEELGVDNFQKLVIKHCLIGGKPLVIDSFEDKLDAWLFTPKWLADNHGHNVENVRDLNNKKNELMTIKHYLNHMGSLTDQFFENNHNYMQNNRQRMYLKDIDCPQVWQDKLKDVLPPNIFYWNDNIADVGEAGAPDSLSMGPRRARGIGIAGDLMSSLPSQMRAANLMCYIGHEGTYTAAHREMSATMGHNIMVHASKDVDESGQPEKPGSSIWFMTEANDRQLVAEWWLSKLGHDIEVEDHFAQIAAWQTAPFKTYVIEQRVGDFVLIPPLAHHQVWNRGTRTMKVAWNRTTVETLEKAIHEALPNSRFVCREEQYKNKAIIFYTLMKYSELIRRATELGNRSHDVQTELWASRKYRQVKKDFLRLFELFKEILLSEMFAPETREKCEYVEFDSNITCSYCRGNIFNRFLTCKHCVNKYGGEDPYDVCMDCYVMGRSCECRSRLQWVEQFKWTHLLERYENWRQQIVSINGGMTGKTPYPLEEERRLLTKKSIAEICQEQSKSRPFHDIKAIEPASDEEGSEEEISYAPDGTIRNVQKKKPRNYNDTHKSCHSCLKRHPKWKMAVCTMCEKYWCYGTLYRAYDMMPKDVMEDPLWECPHCRRMCRTGACARDPRQNPYQPKNTLLGHDTKKVADPRSIESLVDFGQSNLYWTNGSQMERLQAEVERTRIETAQNGDAYDEDQAQIAYDPSMIDPGLAGDEPLQQNPYMQSSHPEIQAPVDHSMVDAVDVSSYPDLGDGQGYAQPGAYALPHQEDETIFVDEQSAKKPRQHGDFEGIKVVHPRNKTTKKRKRKDDEPVATPPSNINKASKQFQNEQDRRQLEKARREDRYLIVYAKMHKKRCRITLKVPKDKLRELERQERDAPVVQTQTVLLRSDIPPPKPLPLITADDTEKPKVASYKARVEDDDDFRSRKRRDRKSKTKQRFEEITVDESDEEFVRDIEMSQSKSARRKSDWLARKNEGEEDFPNELPQDWRDRENKKRNRPSNREDSQDDAEGEPDSARSNRHVDLTNEPDNSDSDESVATAPEKIIHAETVAPGPVKPVVEDPTPTPSPLPGSLAARVQGKKVKIVSASASTAARPKFIGRGGPPGRAFLP